LPYQSEDPKSDLGTPQVRAHDELIEAGLGDDSHALAPTRGGDQIGPFRGNRSCTADFCSAARTAKAWVGNNNYEAFKEPLNKSVSTRPRDDL
jgi:hypothetical protein